MYCMHIFEQYAWKMQHIWKGKINIFKRNYLKPYIPKKALSQADKSQTLDGLWTILSRVPTSQIRISPTFFSTAKII